MIKNFVYFVGSASTPMRDHPVVSKLVGSGCIGGERVGYLFHDSEETRAGLAFETSLRKIDNCLLVVVIPKEDGSIGESTTWEVAYAMHTGKEVCVAKADGSVAPIYDISELGKLK